MIVCLEGINGSGKTTLAAALVAHWRAARGAVAGLAEPVQRTDFGRTVRSAIMNTHDLDIQAETLAFTSARLHAARSLHQDAEVRGAELVVLERWAGAVVAYGTAVGTDHALLDALEGVLTAALPIDRTVLVDVSGALASDRLRAETAPNRFETIGPDYLERVRAGYLTWAGRRDVTVVSGALPPERVAAWAAELVDGLVAGSAPAPA
jgi:dTMP kinase